jgi:hypothetical protein
MKVQIIDLLSGNVVDLTASFTCDHPASSYGQKVMVIDEWDNDAMSHQNWVLGGAKVIGATDAEMDEFDKWHQLIDLMVGQ